MKDLHKATHDNDYVEWTTEDIDYNMIEKSLTDIVDSPYDPENYFKREGTE
jgi:hypothetical protein